MIRENIIKVFAFIYKDILPWQDRNRYRACLALEKQKNAILRQKITATLAEQEHLKEKVEKVNRKLSATTLYFSEKNRHIDEIMSYLSSKPKLCANREIAPHIKFLKTNSRTDKDWESFILHFEEVNQGLISRLKVLHPSLTPNDLRFLSYTYMNLTIKEIAVVMNISLIACKKRKERLAVKMGVPKESDLLGYIFKIGYPTTQV